MVKINSDYKTVNLDSKWRLLKNETTKTQRQK